MAALTLFPRNYMNDALRTDVFVRYSPETIACACIWLAGRQLKIPLPENPPWYRIFRVTLYDIEEIAASVVKLYSRKKVKLEALEAKVEEIRREQQEARLRNKAVSALATPKEVTAFSPVSRSNTPSKANHATAAASPAPRKRSSSDRGKPSGSSGESRSRSKSRSPRASRKKTKRSHTKSRSRSRSHTRSRSPPSRDRHHHGKRKYGHPPSRSSSPAVTPPPRFIKNKEKGPIVRSVSRSRSRSPHRGYDKYEAAHHHRTSKSLLLQASFEKEAKAEKDSKERSSSEGGKLPRYEKLGGEVATKEKYLSKYLEKAERKRLLRESKKYYDNGYDTSKYHHHHHKSASKKALRQRSRSRDRDNRRR